MNIHDPTNWKGIKITTCQAEPKTGLALVKNLAAFSSSEKILVQILRSFGQTSAFSVIDFSFSFSKTYQ